MAKSTSKKFGLGWAAAVVFAAVLYSATSLPAGEEPIAPPPPVPIDPNAPTAEKPITTSPLDQDYVFDDNGRRDPFTFTKTFAVINNGGEGPIKEAEEPDEKTIAQEMLKKIKSAAEAACTQAETALMELDSTSAIAKCDSGMEEFKPVPNLSLYPDLEIVKGRLLRARKAGEQMRSRQAAQRDFDAMNIKIAGVMAMKKNSQAIINSEIVHKGSMVKASGETADVMVDEILPERVVFVFRGYRMMLLLSDAGK